jgi:hypothetical protein
MGSLGLVVNRASWRERVGYEIDGHAGDRELSTFVCARARDKNRNRTLNIQPSRVPGDFVVSDLARGKSDSRGGALRIAAAFRIAKDRGTCRRLVEIDLLPAKWLALLPGSPRRLAERRDRSASGRVVPLSLVNAVGWSD